jgi:hypothetical protein
MTTLIQNIINKIYIQLNEINNNIHESQQKLAQFDTKYDENLNKYKANLIDDILKNDKFSNSTQIIILQNHLNDFNKIINLHNKYIQYYNGPLSSLANEMQDLLTQKTNAEIEINKLIAEIKKLSIGATFIKDNQIIHILNYNFDDMKIKLNKWQQRKQYLLENHNIISNKKKIRENIRHLDKDIKMIYWKLFEIYINKNNALQNIIIKFHNNSNQNLTNINKEIYKHINLPFHHIMGQESYYRFKKELNDVNIYIETKYNVTHLKKDLLNKINEYQTASMNLSNVVSTTSNITDVSCLCNKYKIVKSQINNLDNYIYDLNQKYNIIKNVIQEHQNAINTITEHKKDILKYIKSHEISCQDIFEKIIETRLDRYKVKLNIQKKKEISHIKNQILKYESDKQKLMKEIEIYSG